jgi:PAS domain S-box-containing protein
MSKKTLYAFIVSFLLLITVIVLNRFTFKSMQRFSNSVDNTREIITTFTSLSNSFKSAQIYTPIYDNDSLKNFYTLYKSDADSILSELAHLQLLVKGHEEQQQLVTNLNTHIRVHLNTLMKKNIAELIASGEGWRLNELYNIHQTINQGVENEKRLLTQRKKDLESSTRLTNLLTTSFAFVAIGIIVLTFLSNLFISRHHKWLEGFLESILDTSQNGIVHYKAVRRHGKIVDFEVEFVNRAVDQLLGMKSKEVLGKRLSQISSYVLNAPLFTHFVQVADTGASMEFEHLYRRGTKERWLLVSLAKLDDGLIATFHNITQLKKYQEELKEKISELERSNTELEQYAYVASHDLQEPLRKIRSFGTYLQDTQSGKLDEKGREHLGKMLASAERMSNLIRDILSFSSLNKQEFFVRTDLNQILDSVLQDLDLMITQKQAVIKRDPLPVIEAIPIQMTQLFFNLVSNSLKFARENEPVSIYISCRQLPKEEKPATLTSDHHYYELRFTDNGIGFSQEYADQIFGLFKRLNDKQAYPGSGIGLALCKKVVDNHHGKIRAEGSEESGASFIVQLPERQKHPDST